MSFSEPVARIEVDRKLFRSFHVALHSTGGLVSVINITFVIVIDRFQLLRSCSSLASDYFKFARCLKSFAPSPCLPVSTFESYYYTVFEELSIVLFVPNYILLPPVVHYVTNVSIIGVL